MSGTLRVQFAGLTMLAASLAAISPVSAAALTCAEFQDTFTHAVPELSPQFGRSVVVSRGARGDTRELTTNSAVEGRLTCDGTRFVRFEVQLQMPSTPAGRDAFFRVQLAAAMAGLKWSRNRATQNIIGMSSEAADYLRASEERGDVSVSGKVERHAGAAGDLAAMWTKTDRTFIVLAYD